MNKGDGGREHESKSEERKREILKYARMENKKGRDSMTHDKAQLLQVRR